MKNKEIIANRTEEEIRKVNLLSKKRKKNNCQFKIQFK